MANLAFGFGGCLRGSGLLDGGGGRGVGRSGGLGSWWDGSEGRSSSSSSGVGGTELLFRHGEGIDGEDCPSEILEGHPLVGL